MIRRILLAAAGAIALSGAALAADLPTAAPPPVYLPPPTWTGLYVGLNAGYTWSNSDTVNTLTADVFGNPALPLPAAPRPSASRLPRLQPRVFLRESTSLSAAANSDIITSSAAGSLALSSISKASPRAAVAALC